MWYIHYMEYPDLLRPWHEWMRYEYFKSEEAMKARVEVLNDDLSVKVMDTGEACWGKDNRLYPTYI